MAATIGSLVLRIGASVEGLRSDMGKAAGIVRAGANSMEGALSKIKFGLASAFGGFGIANLTSQFVSANRATDTFRRGMETVTGSAARAEQELKFVQDIANRLGLSLTDAADAYLQLQAAAKGTRLEGEPSRRIFEGVALAMSRLGRSSADISGALHAVQQIISKGKVSAEGLTGQLGERLPGAMGIAARATGLTVQEFSSLLDRGKIIMEDFLPKFAEALISSGKGGKENLSGLTAEVNRMKNEWDALLVSLGDAGVFKIVIDSLKALNDGVAEFNRLRSGKSTSGEGIVEDLNRQIEEAETLFGSLGTRFGGRSLGRFLQRFNPFAPSADEVAELKRRRDAAVLTQQQLERRGQLGANAPEVKPTAAPLPPRGGGGRIETPRAEITFDQSDFAAVALQGGLPESAVASAIATLPADLAKLIPKQGEGFVSTSVGGALISIREGLRRQTDIMQRPEVSLPKSTPVETDQFAERRAYADSLFDRVPLREGQFADREAYINDRFGKEDEESTQGNNAQRTAASELTEIRSILQTRTFPAYAQ